ncbi:MAG: uroporphyrinogen decarboxylase [Bacteroidetes bacterium]|nr:uroporphyrinogen decarboxylase [Bacteroidota bacterium]
MTKFNDSFLRACRMQETEYTPLWLARQAGRYQKEYMKIKEKYSIIEISTIPEVSAEVTMLPINQFELDSAIIFSDILIPLGPMGISFEYKKGYGPLIHNPITTVSDVEKLKVVDPATEMWYTGKALTILKGELNVPCIGFVGAPFTLASYMIEGGPSKNYEKMKAFMYNEPKAWHLLMDKLATVMANYLNFQIESGAMVVQIFDSWVGALDIDDYNEYVYTHVEKMIHIIREKHPTIPIISMGVNSSHLIPSLIKAKPDVIAIDWKTDLAKVWKDMDYKFAVQGNLDPTALFADWSIIEAKTKKLLDSVKGKPGHIFNLGHGILPGTPVENVKQLCKFVHEYTRK